jgi:AcrR family transcriptional regulator
MARWEPDARGRLEKAAMELFAERGYVETTVSEIAAHAGLTERTFFRYFADKKEVLFSGSAALTAMLVEHIGAADASLPPLAVAGAAYEALAASLDARRSVEEARARYQLVSQHPELQERELIKMAGLASTAAEALRARGVAEPFASLAAEAGNAAFKIGFERWVSGKRPRSLAAHVRAAIEATLAMVQLSSGAQRSRARRG